MPQRNELRAHREELQRVQVGLVGLAAVLLIVTLANLVIETARSDSDSSQVAEQITPRPLDANGSGSGSGSGGSGGNEPLADLGVTPTAADTAPSVPDLEPDPRLHERMDRDPDQPASR